MGELIDKLGFNISLLVAQVINFTVVAFMLWRFAYKPVIGMLEQRRKRIEKSIAEAERIEEERENMNQEYEAKIAEAKSEAEKIVQQAKRTGEKLKVELRSDAEEEYRKIIDAARIEIDNKTEEARTQLETETARIVVDAVDKVTEKGIDKKTNEELVNEALKEL